MSEINVLVVIYNKKISESITIDCLKNIPDISIIIADNSTTTTDNESVSVEFGYKYMCMGGNVGLSKAYNTVLDSLNKNDDLIVFFDDDTVVDENYFVSLRKSSKEFPVLNIFAPIVKDSVGILSPCIINGALTKRVADICDINSNNISVINSGLAVRTKVFSSYRYDEAQFLDYVDHGFIRDITDNVAKRICILDTLLVQSFSGSIKTSYKTTRKRFIIFKKDFKYFCKKYHISVFQKSFILAKRYLKLLLSIFNKQGGTN